ncbi:hypothetical protein HMPREF1136_1086 [Actinomyces sp. ICM47]|nr:hypothetical protein HMPREF1136_1086 [Actinomyces sp. ICM47]
MVAHAVSLVVWIGGVKAVARRTHPSMRAVTHQAADGR